MNSPNGSPVVVDYEPPTETDNSGVVDLVCSPPPGSLFAVEETTVTCTATDGDGNASMTSFDVVVTDDQPFGGLPDTGSNPWQVLQIAVVALLLGLVLLIIRRRRSLQPPSSQAC